jgi:hypothetical protein
MEPNHDFSKNPIFTKPYWNRPPNENQGDPTGQVIYTAVGFALTNWEMAEEQLAGLYLRLVDVPEASYDPVRRAYGSIESNSGRRKAIEAAAEAFFGTHWDNGVVRRAFSIVTEAVGWASRRRDDIAHGIVLGQTMDGKSHGHFLFPPDYNTSRTNLSVSADSGDPLYHTMTKYRFTSEQVRVFGSKFGELKETIRLHAGLIRLGIDTFVRNANGVDIFGAPLSPE